MNSTEPFIRAREGLAWLLFPSLIESGIVAGAFSTRKGGVSPPPFDSLNVGSTTLDETVHVAENRRRFHRVTGSPVRDMIQQVHACAVVSVDTCVDTMPTAEANGSGETALPEADGLVTAVYGLPLTIFVADCLSLFVVDVRNRAIGLAHAGWRGTVQNMAQSLLLKMAKEFGTSPPDCRAGIGPGLGPCCFLVDGDVALKFQSTFPLWEDLIIKTSNKWRIDLTEINIRLLQEEGIGREHISAGGFCTSCRSDLFFSYRRDRRNTGRMAASLVLIDSRGNNEEE